MKTATAHLLLGGNMGNRTCYLQLAIDFLKSRVGKIISLSSIWESEPWGFEASQNFYNCVLEIETNFDPNNLLSEILDIEKEIGRVRQKGVTGYSSRPIDIDILYFGDRVVESSKLEIPHPRMHLRRFTLEPLAEIASDFIHPTIKKSSLQLLDRCSDNAKPERVEEKLIF